jgi:hypothetical protein
MDFESPYQPPLQPVFPLEPPGAKASRVLGIVAIVLALTCAGGPVALVLGIVGAILAARAARIGRENPDAYQAPAGIGFVTSIIGATLGAVSGLALMAILGLTVFSGIQKANRASLRERQVKLGDEARALRDGFRGPDGLVDTDRLVAELVHREGRQPNPYTGRMEPLEAGPHPSGPGRISLSRGYSSPFNGRYVPTLFIRASVQEHGRADESTWIVRVE